MCTYIVHNNVRIVYAYCGTSKDITIEVVYIVTIIIFFIKSKEMFV